jgi:Putative Ig domain/Regulator of chromosome condensation (RCC1) repeat
MTAGDFQVGYETAGGRKVMRPTGTVAALLFLLLAAMGYGAHGALASESGGVAAGGYHSCAIKTDDTPVCWGGAKVPGGIGTVKQIAAGSLHTCAIKTDDTPVCWGNDTDGQATIPAGIGTVKQIAAGEMHTCAIKTDDTPVCWGADDFGQATIPGGIGTVKQITAGSLHTCAVKSDDTPVCWGDDSVGQSTIPGGIGTVKQIAAGGEGHTCAIKTDGTPVCWGANDIGESTVPAGIGTVKQITAGLYHTCAIKTDGTPVCWGRTIHNGPQPTLPAGIGTVTEITAGDWHTCALKTDGTVTCWGSYIYGQLGGSPIIESAPLPSLIGVGPFSHTYTAEQPLDGLGAGNLLSRFFLSSGSFPPGLTLDEATGLLSGTPTADGTFSGVVSATNGVFSPDTQAFSITVDTTAPAAPSGLASSPASPSSNLSPRIVGAAEAGSTVRLYDNETCTGSPRAAGSAATFASPGLQITVTAESTTTLYATATDAAGNTSGCSTSKATYVNATDSTTGTGTSTNSGAGTTPTGPTGISDSFPGRRACVVPKVAGKTLVRAERALETANCKLGKVTKPRRRKDEHRRVLVVKSTSPRPGAQPADGEVDLHLRVKPQKVGR